MIIARMSVHRATKGVASGLVGGRKREGWRTGRRVDGCQHETALACVSSQPTFLARRRLGISEEKGRSVVRSMYMLGDKKSRQGKKLCHA